MSQDPDPAGMAGEDFKKYDLVYIDASGIVHKQDCTVDLSKDVVSNLKGQRFTFPEQSTLTRQVGGRGSILDEAKAIINGERQDQYGNPEDAHQLIAQYWNVYLNYDRHPDEYIRLKPKDVMLMMVLFKLAREAHQGKRDNLVDMAGYVGLAGDMEGDEPLNPLPSTPEGAQGNPND